MPQGPKIPDSVKRRVVEVFLSMRKDNTRVTAQDVQQAVEAELRLQDPDSRPGWPGVSTVDKILRQVRREMEALPPDPEDRPWSLLALSFCDIPADAVPTIVRAWGINLSLGRVLTIREARWIGRLFGLYGKDIATEKGSLLEDARLYADAERWLVLKPKSYPRNAVEAVRDWVTDTKHYLLMTGDLTIVTDIVRIALDAATPAEQTAIFRELSQFIDVQHLRQQVKEDKMAQTEGPKGKEDEGTHQQEKP